MNDKCELCDYALWAHLLPEHRGRRWHLYSVRNGYPYRPLREPNSGTDKPRHSEAIAPRSPPSPQA